VGPHLSGNLQGNDVQLIKGKVVCPGFIDIHRHGDAAVFSLPDFGKTELLQGITTAVVGNCGLSPVPANHHWEQEYFQYIEPVTGPIPQGLPLKNFHEYRKGLEELSLPINIGFLAGVGAITTAVKGFSRHPFTPYEMTRAKQYIREAFDAGALGLSFGIMYQPECYSSPEELIDLAISGRIHNGILCVHIRGEGDILLESVEEVIRIAETAGLPVNISHLKATGIKNWQSLIHRAIEKIEAARARGVEITADFYSYNDGSTIIMSLIPLAVLEESMKKLVAKLTKKAGRDQLRREINKSHPGWDNMALGIGWDRIIISSVNLPEHAAFRGRSIHAIAQEEGFKDPEELLAELVAAEEGKVGIITLSMAQEDIDTIARLKWTCLISDSFYGAPHNPHPRLNGAFPKFLRDYVRERNILSMEEAIQKMTSMPAERMGIMNRGRIQKGYAADILVFDPLEFRDNADYSNSRALATGMDTVILNGSIVYSENTFFAPHGRTVFRTTNHI